MTRPNSFTVSAIRLHWIRIPLHEPFRISNGEVSTKDAILVELQAQGYDAPGSTSALTGWGEASPMAGGFYSAETPESTWDALRLQLVPGFLKQPELDPRRCSERFEEFPGEPFAKAGLEGAVWDLCSQLNSRPLWAELTGVEVREGQIAKPRDLASGAAIGLMPTVDLLLERVARFLDEGYRRIKIKIEPGHDVELVRAVRQRFGDIPLMVDANAAYRLEDRHVFDELDGFGLMMIEQPLAREALAEHADLQRHLRTPICLDESADTLDSIREIIRLGSARILNLKVQRMGGLWPARCAHDLVLSAGSRVGSGPCRSWGSPRRRDCTWRRCPISSSRRTLKLLSDGMSMISSPRPSKFHGTVSSSFLMGLGWAIRRIWKRYPAIVFASRSCAHEPSDTGTGSTPPGRGLGSGGARALQP